MADDGVHVIFGTGPVGLAVMDELLTRGLPVRLVNRSGRAPVPLDVAVVGGDASDADFSTDIARGAAVLYHCAAPPHHEWFDRFAPLQEGVVEAARRTGAKLVAVEPMAAYGPPHAKHVTEHFPVAPTTVEGELRAELNAALLAEHARGDVRVAVGRVSDYFGPRAHHGAALGETVLARLGEGRSVEVLGDPDLPHTYSFLPDIGMGMVMLALSAQSDGEVWHLPNPETRSTTALITMLAEELGVEARIRRVSRLALRWTALFDVDARIAVPSLYRFEEPFIVSSRRFEDVFGVSGTKLREAARRTVGWYRSRTDRLDGDDLPDSPATPG